jgi:uncharacterized protein
MPRCFKSVLFTIVLSVCIVRAAFALDIYQGEAAVSDQSTEARSTALGKALLDVAVKVSGDASAASNGTILSAARSPDRYMQRYEYRQEIVREAGKPVVKLYLKGTFYPPSMTQLLGSAGLGAWGRDRPTVAVYVFDGDAPLGADIVSAMRERSSRRGINVRFPGGISAAELSEETAARLASSGQNVLLGRVGEALWLSDGRNTERLTDASLDGLSDRLAGALARRAAALRNAPPESLNTQIVGVRSGADYARVVKYLSALSGVKKLTVLGAVDGKLTLALTVQGGLERLASGVESGKTLRVVSLADAATGDALPTLLEVVN